MPTPADVQRVAAETAAAARDNRAAAEHEIRKADAERKMATEKKADASHP